MESLEKILAEIEYKLKVEKADTDASEFAKIYIEIMRLEDLMKAYHEILAKFLVNRNEFLRKLREMYREGKFSREIVNEINELIRDLEEKQKFIREAGELMVEAVEKFCSIELNIDDVKEAGSNEDVQKRLFEKTMKCREEMEKYRNYIMSIDYIDLYHNYFPSFIRDRLMVIENITNCKVPVVLSLGEAEAMGVHFKYIDVSNEPVTELFMKVRNNLCENLALAIRHDVKETVETYEKLLSILKNLKSMIENKT